MVKTRIAFVIAFVLFLIGLAVMAVVSDEQFLLISIALVAASMVPFFIRFELKQIHTREIVFIAVLAAIAAVSRVPFTPLPNVQPTSFFVIAAALVFGAETGFMIGAFAALVSNMFLGQGPWTPWQMFAWGMIGWTAGLMRHGLLRSRWMLAAFGFIWGFLFDWIMNIWTVASLLPQEGWMGVAAVFAAGFYFDLAHALGNVFFLLLFAGSWIHILRRFQRKYGLLESHVSPLSRIG